MFMTHLYRPKVIRWIGNDTRKVYQFDPPVAGSIKAKEENLVRIKRALVGVVNGQGGTGSRARAAGIMVAGKTGTAQVVNLETEKHFVEKGEIPHEIRDHAWFVAIAPVEKPTLALAILIEHGGHGGRAAAPIAKKMIEAYMGKT